MSDWSDGGFGGFDIGDVGDGGWDFGGGLDLNAFLKEIGLGDLNLGGANDVGGPMPNPSEDVGNSQTGGNLSDGWNFGKLLQQFGITDPNMIKKILQGAGGAISAGGGFLKDGMPIVRDAASIYAGMRDADRYGQQADDWLTKGDEWATKADTFGAERPFYQQQLKDLYNDPSKIENTPGYKFALDQALGAVNNNFRQKGTGGYDGSGVVQAGTLSAALMDRAAGLASQTYNTEADRLSKLAGSQFDGGAAAAQVRMNAMNNANAARNAAFAAKMQGWGQLAEGGANGAGGLGTAVDWLGRGISGLGDLFSGGTPGAEPPVTNFRGSGDDAVIYTPSVEPPLPTGKVTSTVREPYAWNQNMWTDYRGDK